MIFLKERDVARSEAIMTWLETVHYEKIGIFYLVHPSQGEQLATTLAGEPNVATVSQ